MFACPPHKIAESWRCSVSAKQHSVGNAAGKIDKKQYKGKRVQHEGETDQIFNARIKQKAVE